MNARVLIVDDDPTIRAAVADLLEEDGYEVHVAADGAAGIRSAREILPAVIIMDLMMPIMDGMTAIRMLREDPMTREMCIIAFSAGVNFQDHTFTLPVDSVIRKPFDIDTLVAEIHRCVTRGHA